MEIAFTKERLRTLCENKVKAEAFLGIEAAVKLRRRLSDLVAAVTVKELIVGKPNISARSGKELTIELDENFSMVLTPNHMVFPLTKTGAVDWKKVTRIKILRIERTHVK